ncbi:MAG: HindVP family restriction endonuclease [Neisseriaceae bacterium]|nr:HindVP family restriction endonuclease [Neisseriaceae bacterium]
MMQKPHLFGLNQSNRDFSKKEVWGKNQFNSSFPAALCCYLEHKNISANYLCIQNNQVICSDISIADLFAISTKNNEIFFAFETVYMPFQKYIIGGMPRTDLVIQNKNNGQCYRALEIKLTALPDNTTCNLSEDKYGSEIVIRPDSIVYLACSVAENIKNLEQVINIPNNINNIDWSNGNEIINILPNIKESLINICKFSQNQTPFLLQPIWKTQGKSPKLAENCLDVFVWSDIAFVKFIHDICNEQHNNNITRQTRTAIWLYKMLFDIIKSGHFNHKEIIDICSYNTKNDKAFASSGTITNPFMLSPRLIKPIINKNEIKNIILGGGQEMLSPERRFDAIIYNSPELFL